MLPPRTLIIDNGAHTIKSSWLSTSTPPSQFRNCIAKSKPEKRSYTGDELEECADYGGLLFRLAFERGILTNWDVEKTVWDRVFGSVGRGMDVGDPATTQLFVTEPVFNLPNVGEAYDQIVFEEYEFGSYGRCPAPLLIPHGPSLAQEGGGGECTLVVDTGFSFTHIVPVLRGAIVSSSVRRIDIGGKLLTNHLKELISFRQWYMMDQTSVVEKVKETCCFVSNEFNHDWETANGDTNSIVRSYVLPDFVPTSSNKLGYVRFPPTGNTPPASPNAEDEDMEPEEVRYDAKGKGKAKVVEEEQVLQMSNERFTVPECLFNPSSIGMSQAGLAESIAHSIASLPEEVRGMFWANIVCVGGNAGFDGFGKRLESELRSLAPSDYVIRVVVSPAPTLEAILAAPEALASNPGIQNAFITREEYQEGGSNAVRKKLAGLYWSDKALSDELSLL